MLNANVAVPSRSQQYSASVKNELAVLIKALGLPPHHGQESALFVASTSTCSSSHKSAYTSGHYIEFIHTVLETHGRIQHSVFL